MKRLILFSLLVGNLICGGVHAQNTYPWPSTGKVGIGTLTPALKLHVTDSSNAVTGVFERITTLTNALAANLMIKNSSTGDMANNFGPALGFQIRDNAGVDNTLGYVGAVRSGADNSGSLVFMTINAGANAEKMRLTNTGYLGIGTTSPSSTLHIRAATGQSPIITIAAPGISHPFTGLYPTDVGARIASGGSAGSLITQGFTDSNYTAVRVQAHLGVVAPTKPAILLEAFKSTGNNRTALTGTETVLLAGAGDLSLTPANAALSILGNGNVGIGTITPKAKLAVNGDIFSKKVKVTINSADWPDYVFSRNYDLPSLVAVEKYIRDNGHLPDIPSATAVARDGLDLGYNQAALLKKIEELTLYVIEQNKKIEELVRRSDEQLQKNKEQQKEIDQLKQKSDK